MVFVANEMLKLIDFIFVTIQIDATAAELEINSIVIVVEDDLSLFEAAFEFLHKYLKSLILILFFQKSFIQFCVEFLSFLYFLFEASASGLQFRNFMITHLNTTVEIIKLLKDERREHHCVLAARAMLTRSFLCLILDLLFKVIELPLLNTYC
jgi:hypothetical protein